MRIIIANSNPVYHQVEQDIINFHEAILINKRDDLNIQKLQDWNPSFIFFSALVRTYTSGYLLKF